MKTVQACVAAMVVCALGVVATASGAGYPTEATKALGARYDAMARHYLGAGYPKAATKALGARYDAMARHYLEAAAPGIGGEKYSPTAAAALGERYSSMARYYQQAELAQARNDAVAFDWEDAGIGALAATGALALLGLGALGIRSRSAGRPVSRAAS